MGRLVQGQAGKLKWAGAAWADGTLRAGTRSPALQDAELWGIDPALLGLPDHEDGVWEVHADALWAFLAVQTQWRVVSEPKRRLWVGLDYTAAQAGLHLAGLTLTPGRWAEVQMIERGALEALNRK